LWWSVDGHTVKGGYTYLGNDDMEMNEYHVDDHDRLLLADRL
jgi:hypothetical protein